MPKLEEKKLNTSVVVGRKKYRVDPELARRARKLIKRYKPAFEALARIDEKEK